MDLNEAAWRRSRHSGDDGGNCVEVAPLNDVIGVRDSKDPGRGALLLGRAEFGILLEQLKRH
ncbi:hypothetical protein GCM10023085_01960 [Actinomadura viridis]|uniref:DUF397 domain-containing protein n=1 Tax=Actinomadura viridis TaxID=58110 RepID=A0A931DNU3_9ACTN|nr:DUF397 domain-containing protein [Actinomadura viridis]MBG6091016.1 hypothetical protein [Actinomadura viridis]